MHSKKKPHCHNDQSAPGSSQFIGNSSSFPRMLPVKFLSELFVLDSTVRMDSLEKYPRIVDRKNRFVQGQSETG
jgi:hypothetical protein